MANNSNFRSSFQRPHDTGNTSRFTVSASIKDALREENPDPQETTVMDIDSVMAEARVQASVGFNDSSQKRCVSTL